MFIELFYAWQSLYKHGFGNVNGAAFPNFHEQGNPEMELLPIFQQSASPRSPPSDFCLNVKLHLAFAHVTPAFGKFLEINIGELLPKAQNWGAHAQF